jgi:predicted dehydrogenase
MQIAIIGCGYIADSYLRTLPLHPELQLTGVMDRDPEHSRRLAHHYSVACYPSLDTLLQDGKVDLVVNLTNPRSHFSVSKACLEARKHVYSEKPLAMTFIEAEQLVELAGEKGVRISSAPSRLLAETAQTLWKALREKVVGPVRVAYAEMDHGMTHRMRYRKWLSASGAPWPYKDEFEVGCTIEHGEYPLRLLTAFFGPVQSVTAFSSCQIPDKETEVPLEVRAPDFSVACLTFRSGVVARLTCSIIAEPNRTMCFFGDEGILYTQDISKPRCPVYIRRRLTIRRRTMLTPWRRKYPMVCPPRLAAPVRARDVDREVDFCLGIAELAGSIQEGRPCRLGASYCLHTTEVVLAIQNALDSGSPYVVKTSFEPIEPMPWALA